MLCSKIMIYNQSRNNIRRNVNYALLTVNLCKNIKKANERYCKL